ncbi:uncharacterized protein CMC5_055260 [Chondromyces crocatus]|uniref:Uncharacterized protein n=1 Tax=Chondromyces crocatus TaxID=52 RepID=A0A0K1EL20_CHOCO|nr:uncharacterized protein CMC5_055260 [Chondromyces crocatus]
MQCPIDYPASDAQSNKIVPRSITLFLDLRMQPLQFRISNGGFSRDLAALAPRGRVFRGLRTQARAFPLPRLTCLALRRGACANQEEDSGAFTVPAPCRLSRPQSAGGESRTDVNGTELYRPDWTAPAGLAPLRRECRPRAPNASCVEFPTRVVRSTGAKGPRTRRRRTIGAASLPSFVPSVDCRAVRQRDREQNTWHAPRHDGQHLDDHPRRDARRIMNRAGRESMWLTERRHA